MAIIASLDVALGARTQKFDKNLKQSRTRVGAFGRGIEAINNRLSRINPAMVAAGAAAAGFATAVAAAAAGVREVVRQFDKLDAIGKTADKLGVAADELVGLRKAAAEFSGLGSSQFDTALQRMTRRVSEAAAGTGEARAAIAELGLSAKTLNAVGPSEAFKRISEAIRELPNKTDRLRIAFKLFDAEGAGLVSTLSAGRDALEEVGSFARRAGLALSNIQVNAIEQANDALQRMRDLLTGSARIIAAELAPQITALSRLWTDSANNITGGSRRIAASLRGVGKAAAVLTDIFLVLKGAGTLFNFAIRDLITGGFKGWILGLNRALDNLQTGFTAGSLKAYKKNLRDVQKELESGTAAATGFAGSFDKITRSSTQAADAIKEKWTKVGEMVKTATDRAAELRKSLVPDLTPMQKFSERLKEINKLFEMNLLTAKERNKLARKAFAEEVVSKRRKAAKERMASIKKEMARRQELARSVGERLQENLKKLRDRTQATGGEGMVAPAALDRGSQAAFSAFREANVQQKESEKSLEELKEQTRLLARIYQDIKRGKIKPAPLS